MSAVDATFESLVRKEMARRGRAHLAGASRAKWARALARASTVAEAALPNLNGLDDLSWSAAREEIARWVLAGAT